MSYNLPEQSVGVAVRERDQEVLRNRPNLWLRLTSSGWDKPQVTVQEREVVRRSRLTAYIILALFVMELLLLPTGLKVASTLFAVGFALLGTVIAAILNRAGYVTLAGTLLVLLLSGAILGSILGATSAVCGAGATCSPFVTNAQDGQLSLIYLPAYDLLTISVIVGASILPRSFTFVIAIFNVALICADMALQPHAPDVAAWVSFEGIAPLIARPVALQIIVATIAFLWVRGTEQAIQRADRAEELAQMEHTIAEQKRQLDIGVQQILQTHIRAANGDLGARAPLGQENVLWQVAASLNNLLSRLQKSGQAEHQLRRTEDELRRLAAALDDAQAGRRPLWPAQSGTAVDLVIERLARPARLPASPSAPAFGNVGSGMLGQRPPAPPAPFAPVAPVAPVAAAARSGPLEYPGAGLNQGYGLHQGLGYGPNPGPGRLGPDGNPISGPAFGRPSAPAFGAGPQGNSAPVVAGPPLPGNPQVLPQPPLPAISQFPPSGASQFGREDTFAPRDPRLPTSQQPPVNNPWAFPFESEE